MKYICKDSDCERGKEPMSEDGVLRWVRPPLKSGGLERVLLKCPYCRGRLEEVEEGDLERKLTGGEEEGDLE